MQSIYFIFNYKKATQALNYLAQQEGGKINKMKVLKLIYFADRYHLRKYGRLITNDNYLAMQYGPVPSSVKDIAESHDFLDDTVKVYSLQFIQPINNLVLESIAEVDRDILSESDLEALQFAWDNFGHLTQFQLAKLTHSYPEWLRHEDDVARESCVPMQLLDFLQDPIDDADKCFELSEQDKSMRSEQIAELAHIELLWA